MFKAELLYLDKTRNPWKLAFSFYFSWKIKFSVQCIAKYTAGARWGWRQKSRWKKHFWTRWKKEHWCNRFLYPLLHTLFLHSYKLFLLLHTHTHSHTHTHTLHVHWLIYTQSLFCSFHRHIRLQLTSIAHWHLPLLPMPWTNSSIWWFFSFFLFLFPFLCRF